MSKTVKKILQEEYSRLKKNFEKIFKQRNRRETPQLVLQPIKNLPPSAGKQ